MIGSDSELGRMAAAIPRTKDEPEGGPPARAEAAPGRERGSRTIQSLERAIDLLEMLASSAGGLSLTELAEKSGLNPSTCHHLLATLAKRGMAGRSSRNRNYVLGPRITDLSESRLRQFNLIDVALPELRGLNEATKESVQLASLQGGSLATLAKLDSKLPVRVGFDDEAARSDAAHATATGKAILAWLPETELVRLIGSGPLKRFTPKTVHSLEALTDELRLVRRGGCAVEDEEFQLGVVCVGGSVRDQSGAVVGSIGVSMPGMRARGDHLESVKRQVKEFSARVSAAYGSQAAP